AADALVYVLDHGFSVDVRERLPREASGPEPRGDDRDDGQIDEGPRVRVMVRGRGGQSQRRTPPTLTSKRTEPYLSALNLYSTDAGVPRIARLLVLAAAILIPFRILGHGYLPGDDALRHAGKVVSGKDWSEILLMRAYMLIDCHPG